MLQVDTRLFSALPQLTANIREEEKKSCVVTSMRFENQQQKVLEVAAALVRPPLLDIGFSLAKAQQQDHYYARSSGSSSIGDISAANYSSFSPTTASQTARVAARASSIGVAHVLKTTSFTKTKYYQRLQRYRVK